MSTLLVRSIGESFDEILALESSLFLFILFGAGLACDVIKGTPCRIPIEIVQTVCVITCMWVNLFTPNMLTSKVLSRF